MNFLRDQAKAKSCTIVQLFAFAWILAQHPWIVPIPGTTKLNRLEENMGVVDVQFTPEELQNLNSCLAQIQIHGA